jgi:molybdopterin-synthase adenylyltransferase
MDMFSRNIEFWGEKKQALLKNSSILIAGMGGLGCTVAENLVRAGIGKLILLDNDEIEISNLNRQILYDQHDTGKSKVEVAKHKLKAINPELEIEVFQKDVSELANLHLPRFDGIADCLDNYESRFILNDALEENQFLVHGGVKNDFGQITTIKNGITQNLRQIFGDYKDEAGLGIIPQTVITIGSLMTHEIINNLFDKPQLLNKLLIVELSDFSMFKVEIKR